MRRLLRTLSALLLAAVLSTVVVPPPAARAAGPTLTEAEAIAILQEYNIVRGDERGNLNLDSFITREEAAAIFVRAKGAEPYAELLADVVPFPDARGRWSAGVVAMAERMGLMRGYPDGSFRPTAQITYAEVLTVLLRMVEQEPEGPWNAAAIVEKAERLGLVSPGLPPNNPAIRRRAFWALAEAITAVPVNRDRNLLSQIDRTPPSLSLDRVASPTSEENLVVGGTASGARRVFVDGAEASFDRSTGRFELRVPLEVGVNEILVVAVDAAGNERSEKLIVERRSPASRVTITGPSEVVAGQAVRLTVTATDRNGNPVPLEDAEAEVTGVEGSFDVRTSTLLVGSKTGSGTLTVRAGSAYGTYRFTVVAPSAKAARLEILEINRSIPIALDTEYTVTVRVLDASGRVVTDDYGRTVTLVSSGPAKVTITPERAETNRGVVTFTLTGKSTGLTTLTAASPGLETATRSLEVLTDLRVMLVPSKQSLAPDGTSYVTIRAELQDATGRRINNNTGRDMVIGLTATGTDAKLENPYLVIAAGRRDSGSATAKLTAGLMPGTVSISGTFQSTHNYAIQNLQFPVTSALAGTRFELVAQPSVVAPEGETTIRIRVLDGTGRVVTTGSYAFQLKVSSSNAESTYRGLPMGVSLTFASNNPNERYYPVDDGVAPTDPLNDPYSVVGRTYRGEAQVRLRYARGGVITVSVVPVGTTAEAYHPEIGFGPASSSIGMWSVPLEVTFRGEPAALVLTADSAIGNNLKGAAVAAKGQVTLTAKVVDSYGTVIPGYQNVVRLERVGGDQVTTIVGVHERSTTNGQVSFTLQAGETAGADRYRVSIAGTTLYSEEITVAVRKAPADTPVVVAVRGVSESSPAQTAGFVGPDATHLAIQLEPQASPTGEKPYWVQVRVYRDNESQPLYTQVIDLSDATPVVKVPRSLLRTGRARYRVVIHNGFGDTAYSSTLDPVSEALVATYSDNYRLNSANYDAATGRLYLYTSGLYADGVIDKSKFTLEKDGQRLWLGDDKVTVSGYSPVVLTLGDLAETLNPDVWHGAVYVRAETGWYADKGGTTVARAFTAVPVRPMSVITGGALDLPSKRLYLEGVGLTQGSIQWGLVKIRTSDTDFVALRPGYEQVTYLSDTQAILTLSDATYRAVMQLPGTDHYLTADVGWILASGNSSIRGGAITGQHHPVLLRLLVTNARYEDGKLTLESAGGFKGLLLDPSKLVFLSSPGGTQVRPTQTPQVEATQDGFITIELDPADQRALEAAFAGGNVYMNTEDGWLTNAQGWQVQKLPDHSVLFFVPGH